ncbi:3-phenylpropionate/cinnamic acid dioxygenase subunit beta [Geodermatophilus ruber]|uniref:Biphenyl 2,3-dioxygenase beta subunit n=1 Tax=Geodermatophilus ruber TaxID=504800 RepID=A0A1I4BP79_9ACTN|nr:3-phenylpropionate/cinnamic acid dioxygenase subunit beta [Geodermatophilus ruber]SFK70007.1 biphenyl 2,3-dioxygenase beta subunit [Geodermatophilus ruber]
MTGILRATTTTSSTELQHEIEQFLYAEAALLDRRKLDDWFELMAPDVHYFMPVRSNRLQRELDQEVSGVGDIAHFDETHALLYQRVRRFRLGTAWAEDPPSRTRRLITNVRVAPTEDENEYTVESNFLAYRTRLEREQDMFVGQRTDLLRRSNTDLGWQIARRTILLDQATVLSKNISIFL